MNSESSRYWISLQERIASSLQKNEAKLVQVAKEIHASLAAGGVWHLFGSGHSALLVDEAFHRAGGLVPVNSMTEIELSPLVNPARNRDAERREGGARAILERHAPLSGEILWIVSNSGINPSSVDMAIEAKARGLRVWALTCVEHSRAAASRHSSKKKLFELADGVIDTMLPPGDAILESEVEGKKFRHGAASLAMGTVLLHSVEALVVKEFVRAGELPPVYLSANLPGGDAHNQALEARYSVRISRLRN
jgi:uncharacterized phosphosugar-binding protein